MDRNLGSLRQLFKNFGKSQNYYFILLYESVVSYRIVSWWLPVPPYYYGKIKISP